MIILIEGTRACGKTYLINKFFEQNTDPRIKYYKFYFADWVKRLSLQSVDNDKCLHYLSLGNILTVLEQMKDKKDEIIIFDRAIFSAYVWALLRKRLSANTAMFEIEEILNSEYYKDCKTIFIEPKLIQTQDDIRKKDMWDGIHTTEEEKAYFEELFIEMISYIRSIDRDNEYHRIFNDFSDHTVDLFTGLMNGYTQSL